VALIFLEVSAVLISKIMWAVYDRAAKTVVTVKGAYRVERSKPSVKPLPPITALVK